MKNNSVLIISNDVKNGNVIADKIKLLRDCDDIKTVTYIEAISVLNSSQPSIIIVFSSNADSVGIVKEIRTLKNLDKVPIILAMDVFIEDAVLYAFDNGIDDFFLMDDSDVVILMRVLWVLQKSILYKQLEMNNDILTASGIIDHNSGIYSEEQASLVLKTFFDKNIRENVKDTVFMCVKPIFKHQKRGINQNIIQFTQDLIKKIPRSNDVIAYGKNSTFYLLLYNSGISGAKSVSARINNSLENDCDVFISATEVTLPFDETEPVLIKSLDDQIASNIEFNFLYGLNNDEISEIVESEDEAEKYNDFRAEFYSGLEKIILPVFNQMKEKISDVFPKSQIDFNMTEAESRFLIADTEVTSEILITYPSYTKILIDVKHTKQSKQTQLRRLTFDIEDFSAEKLLEIIRDVIQEFATIRLSIDKTENEFDTKQE